MDKILGNHFMIGVRGESIVFLRPIPKQLTKAEALNLAAWLAALADDDGESFEAARSEAES